MATQTFGSQSSAASGTFNDDGRMVENGKAASASGLSVAYNAATQSYTITLDGYAGTFSSADKMAQQSAEFTAYQKTDGTKTSSLALSNPATSGTLTYTYVGGGSLERSETSGASTMFQYDAFTYGVKTAASSLPRTGTAMYSVDLVGARGGGAPLSMAGAGTVQADFLNGAIETQGLLATLNPADGSTLSTGVFYGQAALASGVNAFSGRFQLQDDVRFDGGWQGSFYGPTGEEVGATWQLTAPNGAFATGWMVGRVDGGIAPFNTSLSPIRFEEAFAHRFSAILGNVSGGANAAGATELDRSDAAIAYDPATGGYRYVDRNGNDQNFAAASRDSAASNTATSVYRISGTDGTAYTLSLSKPGAGNPDIALTYMSLGRWQRAQTASADAIDRWFVWGVRTNGFQIPTGTGSYAGIIKGSGVTINGGPAYALAGTSTLSVDFGAGTFTGSLNPIGTNLANGTTRDFGTFSFDGGMMDLNGGLDGNVVNSGGSYLGFFEGALYGSAAQELGGTFGFQTEPSSNSGTVGANAAYLSGGILATRTGH